MYFTKFIISNFKGISNAEIFLEPYGAGIFTLVGLNESGKTTLLEALHAFGEIGGKSEANSVVQYAKDTSSFVPKSKVANFSDDIQIKAFLKFENGEKERIIKKVENECKVKLDNLPEEIVLTRGYQFIDTKYEKTFRYIALNLSGKAARAKQSKKYSAESQVWKTTSRLISNAIPEILYFPTFLFEQPEKIFLNKTFKDSKSKEAVLNDFYLKILKSIALKTPSKTDIDTHIAQRKINGDEEEAVQATLDQMSDELTRTIFTAWSDTFDQKVGQQELNFKCEIENDDEGEKIVYIKLGIKYGSDRYQINQRSLGFRWFFSFLMFTIYRNNIRPALYLFDEPASNLHAKAQMRLLNSFKRIAKFPNAIIYSTHSHYMIEPEWLEQAYIVVNTDVDYESELNPNKKGHTDIQVTRYKNFVGQMKDSITYFQPIMDRLDVAPSKLELFAPSILVEGKGDYSILNYGIQTICQQNPTWKIVPTRGAEGMDELIGLFLGWGVDFMVCLDDDKKGQNAKLKYIADWGLLEERVITLRDVSSTLEGKTIEGFLNEEDKELIRQYYGLKTNSKLNKKQISSFFSEHLARNEVMSVSNEFKNLIKAFVQKFTTLNNP